MSIKHHLTKPILMAYSAGTLPEAFNLVVATHISMCDDCRAELAAFDTVGGAVLQECDAAPLGAGCLQATLDRIAAQDTAPEAPRGASNGVFPTPLQDYVGGDLEAVKWRPVGGGVRQAILKTSADASARLLHIPAGTAVPDHGHRGQEITLVLQGAFKDEHDRFARGDVEVADEDVHHTPVAEPGADCICLAVADAPLKFNSLLARIAQPFLGI